MNRLLVMVIAASSGMFLGMIWLMAPAHRHATTLLAVVPAHGTSFLIEFDPAAAGNETNVAAILRENLRKRFARMDAEIFGEPLPSNQFRLTAPLGGSNFIAGVSRLISRTGHLEFRLVHPESDSLVLQQLGEIGFEVLALPHQTRDGRNVPGYLVKKTPELSGEQVTNAFVTLDSLKRPQINFTMNAEGAKTFAEVTRNNLNRALAIVVDGKLLSAPVIRSPIEGGRASIEGNFTAAEALDLAASLDAPLPVPVRLIETKSF